VLKDSQQFLLDLVLDGRILPSDGPAIHQTIREELDKEPKLNHSRIFLGMVNRSFVSPKNLELFQWILDKKPSDEVKHAMLDGRPIAAAIPMRIAKEVNASPENLKKVIEPRRPVKV
jgi:hypothetical protein